MDNFSLVLFCSLLNEIMFLITKKDNEVTEREVGNSTLVENRLQKPRVCLFFFFLVRAVLHPLKLFIFGFPCS